jgi:hypothetical protein
MACDQTRDASVAIHKRMYPQQPVVSRSNRKDRLGLAGISIDLSEAVHETHQGSGADGDMAADPYVTVPQLARNDSDPLAGRRVFNPQELIGK